jgi:hypothetical protein
MWKSDLMREAVIYKRGFYFFNIPLVKHIDQCKEITGIMLFNYQGGRGIVSND